MSACGSNWTSTQLGSEGCASGFSRGSAEVVHCHMVFHLAHPFIRGRWRVELERALEQLIDRHVQGSYLDCTLKLTFRPNANGFYGAGSERSC